MFLDRASLTTLQMDFFSFFQVSEANYSLLSENLSNARSSAQLSTDLQVSEATSG